MDFEKALNVLKLMADGVDPATGVVLARDHVCQQPDVIRALTVARDALSRELRRNERYGRAQERNPNTGRSWSPEEDGVLLSRFKSGLNIDAIASLHQRTTGGIRARLEKLGQNTTGFPVYPPQQSRPRFS